MWLPETSRLDDGKSAVVVVTRAGTFVLNDPSGDLPAVLITPTGIQSIHPLFVPFMLEALDAAGVFSSRDLVTLALWGFTLPSMGLLTPPGSTKGT